MQIILAVRGRNEQTEASVELATAAAGTTGAARVCVCVCERD